MGVGQVQRTDLRLPTVGTGSESGKTVREVGMPSGSAWPGLGGSRAPALPSGAHERRPYRVLASDVSGVAALQPRPTVGTGSGSGKTNEGVGTGSESGKTSDAESGKTRRAVRSQITAGGRRYTALDYTSGGVS